MKRALLISVVLLLAGATGLRAQNIALGERVPELRIASWLGGQQPVAAPLTYLEFFHSSNAACIRSLDQLKSTANTLGSRLRVVVIVQETPEKVASLLTPYVSDRIGIGFDASGKTFANFGVSYVPFGVLVDAKNRALWMGNSLQLTPATIEKITK